jgi:hypothetical protein
MWFDFLEKMALLNSSGSALRSKNRALLSPFTFTHSWILFVPALFAFALLQVKLTLYIVVN